MEEVVAPPQSAAALWGAAWISAAHRCERQSTIRVAAAPEYDAAVGCKGCVCPSSRANLC